MMMPQPIIIAHRGLTAGPDAQLENHPDQIAKALSQGFHAEIDLWRIDETWMLGHDGPTYITDWEFISQENLWIHCKNLAAFYQLRNIGSRYNFFWHDSDAVVLTSRLAVWTYMGLPEAKHYLAVCVMPEVTYDWDTISAMVRAGEWYGYCTDYPKRLRSCLD